MTQDAPTSTVLLIGASRGLGLGMADEFAKRGWHVVATVREGARTELNELADAYPHRVEVERVDISQPEQVATLRDRLVGRSVDMLFINAGAANMKGEIAGEIATDEYARVLVTNALGPMRLIEACRTLVGADGLIGLCPRAKAALPTTLTAATRSTAAARPRSTSSCVATPRAMPTIRARWC